ncbi:MAG: pilus assembly protein N-terminal domain-containing protein [Pseudomonadales bacterium]|nr:pilus assembly protein N-terminal domain-containing protein [Pseudomonadales bacterium]
MREKCDSSFIGYRGDNGLIETKRILTKIILCLIPVLVFWGQGCFAEGYRKTITIVQGQTKILPYPGVTRVSIGHPDIANVRNTAPDEVLLTGLQEGVTDLRIWTSGKAEVRYLLKVVDGSWRDTLTVAKAILSDVEGVEARAENNIVFIEGRVIRSFDLGIITEMKTKFSAEISAGKMIFNVAKPAVSLRAMIMLDVKVLEVKKTGLKEIGIDWADSTAGPSFGILGDFRGAGNFEKGSSFFGFHSDEYLSSSNFVDGERVSPVSVLSSRINLMVNSGVAKVLAEPKLITRSGSSAEFLGGGEIPIPTIDDRGRTQVIFKEVGVILNMEPTADPEGYIVVKLEVEISRVDSSVEVLSIPGFVVNRARTEMNMLSGQTMVVAGMLTSEDGKNIEKVPGLSSIPIIGELFKSREFVNNQTELVVFVTPYLIDPESERNRAMLDHAKVLQSKAYEDTKFDIFD